MNDQNKMRVVICSVVALASAVITKPAQAVPINFTTGFEAPNYTPNSVPGNGFYRQDGSEVQPSGLPTIMVATPGNGSAQSLLVTNTSPEVQADQGSVTYIISPVRTQTGADNVVLNGTPNVHIQWDMKVNDTANINDTTDEWSLDVYDSSTQDRTASVARSAMATTPGGAVTFADLYATGSNGAYNPTPITTAAPLSGVWGRYTIDMNYLTRLYTVGLNGTTIGTYQFNSASDNGLDVNFTDNGRGLDSANFDNFSVTTPEPMSLGLVGVAATMLGRRRRQS